jgi:mRNA-degrading endonuclease toxin of MazEF toxin-antitoxin module
VTRSPDLASKANDTSWVQCFGSSVAAADLPWSGDVALLSHSRHDVVSQAMSDDDKLIDLNAERAKRVHDLNDKRLNEVRQAFEQAMPLGKVKKKSKNKPKKR